MTKYTVQEILHHTLDDMKLPLHQLKAADKLYFCRTAALGGHTQYCENNHVVGVWYNSCKHRACPQCRSMASEEWLQNTRRRLLSCEHHHIVFTIPSQLHGLWKYNRREMADILFTSAQDTLKQFSKDKRYLGAMPGMMSVLHTWGRNLSLHPHLHVLMTHGGLADNGEWVVPKRSILFPAKPVMQVYRAIFIKRVRRLISRDELKLPPDLGEQDAIRLLNTQMKRDWVVHFCERYDYADGVAKYLSRYVKSGPMNNGQLVRVSAGQVVFKYKSHRRQRYEFLRMSEEQFARRLLEHVPEPGRPSVRYCGLYNSGAIEKLNVAREELGQDPVEERIVLTGLDYLADRGRVPECAKCEARVVRQESIVDLRRR
ncbi:Uncharacterised protein [BD1-7 clade bacterium]|uniref:Uncharacterized protein n=1 Tax=BD1-7 clade bacterium TaxID=2029982 RepID=A0A5S9R0J4_9GAMM|nr:Uncharacterised protein [BD1-7 clade bacterium]